MKLKKEFSDPPEHIIRLMYADTPSYLRKYIEKKATQEKDKEIAVITSEWNDSLNEAVKKAKQEVITELKNKCNIWDSAAIIGSSETKADDKWISLKSIEKFEKRKWI